MAPPGHATLLVVGVVVSFVAVCAQEEIIDSSYGRGRPLEVNASPVRRIPGIDKSDYDEYAKEYAREHEMEQLSTPRERAEFYGKQFVDLEEAEGGPTSASAAALVSQIAHAPPDQVADLQAVMASQGPNPYELNVPTVQQDGSVGMNSDQRQYTSEQKAGAAGMSPVPNKMQAQPLPTNEVPNGKVGGVDEPWQYQHPLQPYDPATVEIAKAALKGDAVKAVKAAMGRSTGAYGIGMGGQGAYGGMGGINSMYGGYTRMNPMMRGMNPMMGGIGSRPGAQGKIGFYPGPVNGPGYHIPASASPYYRNSYSPNPITPQYPMSSAYPPSYGGGYLATLGAMGSSPYGPMGSSMYGSNGYSSPQYGSSYYSGQSLAYSMNSPHIAMSNTLGLYHPRGQALSNGGLPDYSDLYAAAYSGRSNKFSSRNPYPGVTGSSFAPSIPTRQAPSVDFAGGMRYTAGGTAVPQRPLPPGFTLPRHPINNPLYSPRVNAHANHQAAMHGVRSAHVVSNTKIYQPTAPAMAMDAKPQQTRREQYQNPSLLLPEETQPGDRTSMLQNTIISQVASYDPALSNPYSHWQGGGTPSIYGGVDHYMEE